MEHSNASALVFKEAKTANAKSKTSLLLQKSAPFLRLPHFPSILIEKFARIFLAFWFILHAFRFILQAVFQKHPYKNLE